MLAAFGLERKGQEHCLVPCALTLLSLEVGVPFSDTSLSWYTKNYNALQSAPEGPNYHSSKYGTLNRQPNPLEPRLQGSLLLQALLRLSEPHYQIVTDRLGFR